MTRSIKFQFWDTKDLKMIDWLTALQTTYNSGDFPVANLLYYLMTSDRFIKRQFTWLLDKNGKEIYEGDICSGHGDGNGTIQWSDFDGWYEYVFGDENSIGIWEVKWDLSVIGNLYQNPELLTNK